MSIPQHDVSPSEPASEASSVLLSAESEDKKSVHENVQSSMHRALKFSYKEDQWSPLNTEGKKQYDRDFLLQLQCQPVSLCKPKNLPNIDVIKNKAYIQKLPEVNRAVPVSLPVRTYPDPFLPRYSRGDVSRPPHHNRWSLSGREIKPLRVQLREYRSRKNSENAWKSSPNMDKSADESAEIKEKKKELHVEYDEEEKEMRYGQLGNIRFIGELFKLNMLIEPLMHECIMKLLRQQDEGSLEYLCQLFKTIGRELDEGKSYKAPRDTNLMDDYFAEMQRIVDNHLTSSRVRFLLQDVIDLKKDNWIPRKAESNSKIIDEIHKEAESEDREQQLLFSNMNYSKQMPDNRDKSAALQDIALSEDDIEKKTKPLIDEFLHNGDFETAIKCVMQLISPSTVQYFINSAINQVLDQCSQSRYLLGQLLCSLEKKKIITLDQYKKGLLKTIGKELDAENSNRASRDANPSNWISSRDENKPKTIDQIHKEAESEAPEQQLLCSNINYSKRMPDDRDRKKSAACNLGHSGEDWIQSSKSSKRSYKVIDPNKLKLTKPDEVESIGLGHGGKGIPSWFWCSNGNTKASDDSDAKRPLANRYSAFTDQNLAPSYDARRGVQRSVTPPVEKTQSTFKKGQKKLERIRRISMILFADVGEPKVQDVKRSPECLLNGKAVDVPAVALRGVELSEDDVKKKTKPIIDEFLHNGDFEEGIKCITELASPTTVHYFINSAINQVLDQCSQSRYLLGQLLCSLEKKKIITLEQYKKGFCGILENLDDYALDIPLIWEYIGEILEPMIGDNKLPLTFLKDVLEPCMPSQTAAKLVSAVLHCAAKKKDTTKLGELWKESGLEWTDFLGSSANVDDFIHTYKLEFIISPTKRLPTTEMSPEDIKKKNLKSLLEKTEKNEEIIDWIVANVSQNALTEPSFIRALVTAVHEDAITGTDPKYELDITRLRKRIPLLTRYIDHNGNLEFQALCAIQALMNQLNQPKGILRQIFDILYDDDVITEQTFKLWEQSSDPNELEGKAAAVQSVKSFFTWLREAESRDSVDDD
ncbi:Eukaryotic translation initiation factor 4 gamma 3, partial [Stegodyphus mimosarum]